MKLIIADIENIPFEVHGEYKMIRPQEKIHNCIGCFGCWVKTPGICVIHDGYETTGSDMGKCSELIVVSRCDYGSYSPFVKTVMDRGISYIHPDFVIRKGEMHHKRRYKNVIALSAYFYGENITEREKWTAGKLLKANADNYDGKVKEIKFFESIEELEGIRV
ncbi:MAG: flavodoxin family protein [Acetatifactor sp.]|nr:flavodoxin family protein [Acetatifactor sp.]